jgi:hypothetical protein
MSISVLVKEKIAKLKEYESFDLDEKQDDLDKAKKALDRAQKEVNRLTAEITDYKVFLGLPVEAEDSTLSDAELIAKLEEVMRRFPNGANGKDITKVLALPGVDSNTISKLYWREGQSTLKKTGTGLQTKYFLASPDDLVVINQAKEQERAAREAVKAKSAK